MVIIPRTYGSWQPAERSARDAIARVRPAWARPRAHDPRPPSRLSAEAIQLQDVVRRAHQRPFRLHLRQAPQQKGSEAARLLDLPDHRFDDRFAPGVDGRAGLREQLPSHPVDARGGRRQRAARTGARAFAMFLFARRDVGVDPGVRDRGQILVRAVAGVREQLRRACRPTAGRWS